MKAKIILDDLKRSGLTRYDADKLKLKHLSQPQIKKLTTIENALGYEIPYFDIKGKKLEFTRVRLFYKDKPNPLRAKSTKQIKYWQPPNTEPQLYFPPISDWKKIANDTSVSLLITEGEKKAAKACKMGLPTIGLGGVWSFRSKKNIEPLINDFKLINLKDRTITIVYDSDLSSNDQVRQAQLALAKELVLKGAKVFLGKLPDLDDGKTGLDDYFLDHTKQDFLDLPKTNFSEGEELYKLNTEIVYIEKLCAVYHFKLNTIFSCDQITKSVFSNRFYNTIENDKLKRKPVAKAWLEWEERRTVKELVYEPGEPLIVNNSINTWSGWGVKPKQGDVKIFVELVNHLFAEDNNFKKWFWQWLAYPIQYPGTKLLSAVVLWSLATGTGKSFLAYIIGDIYGSNYVEMGQEELHATYNEWAVNKQFILGEEITGLGKRQDADRIKSMITREKLTVNEKYKPTYQIRDCINYIFTSNHPDAFLLERYDRRMAVHEITETPKSPTFYKRLDTWRKNGGAAHLMYYLLHKVDTKSFNPKERPPLTQAKREMIEMSFSDLDLFCEMLRTNPDSILKMEGSLITRDLFTVGELLKIYDPLNVKKTTRIALGKALRRAGFKQCPVTMTAHGSKKLWAIRNPKKWTRSLPAERIANYDDSIILLDKARKIRKF